MRSESNLSRPLELTIEQQLRIERKKLDAIRRLGRVLGATVDLDQLLLRLLESVTEILDAERATIFLIEEDGALVSTMAQGGYIAPIRLQAGIGIAGWVAQSGETVNIADAYADSRFHPEVDQRSGFRTQSILCMAMPDHTGRTLGVMEVLNKRSRPFDSHDEAILQTVAAHAGISIENSKLYRSVLQKNQDLLHTQRELRQRISELDLLVEIDHLASASLDLDELLERLLLFAIQLGGAEAGSIVLRDESSSEFYFRSTAGSHSERLRKARITAGQGIVGWAALHKQPLLVNDPEHDARFDRKLAEAIGVPARHILAAPLLPAKSENEWALGAIELVNKCPPCDDGFSESDLKLLVLIAGQASRAIQIARERVERQQSDRLAAIGQMLSGVLHDLRTPITIASGYAQLMVNSQTKSERESFAELILRQFDLLSAMTGEVLAFARGESKLLIRKVFLQEFVEEMRQQLEREFDGKPVELNLDTRYRGVAYFDQHKIFRVVHNLARNALQAMPSGGRFHITIDADDQELLLSFHDTGTGIPEAMRGRLFSAFATSGKRDGNGLGLAIVKKIVDEHGGRIRCESQPGEGTTFHLALPLGKEAISSPIVPETINRS